MTAPLQFPFLPLRPHQGPADLFPLLPITLQHQTTSVPALGLLDTGVSVNVLPYDLGLQLGFDWDQQKFAISLGGILASVPAWAVQFGAMVGTFPPVSLSFAWTKSNQTPLILGQTNFFPEFDVCLYRSRGVFEVKPKA
jgi:hypothetical protein